MGGFQTDNAMEVTKTDMQKIVSYLDDAARLYDALPMLSCKSRAHMIRRLIAKLRNNNTNKR